MKDDGRGRFSEGNQLATIPVPPWMRVRGRRGLAVFAGAAGAGGLGLAAAAGGGAGAARLIPAGGWSFAGSRLLALGFVAFGLVAFGLVAFGLVAFGLVAFGFVGFGFGAGLAGAAFLALRGTAFLAAVRAAETAFPTFALTFALTFAVTLARADFFFVFCGFCFAGSLLARRAGAALAFFPADRATFFPLPIGISDSHRLASAAEGLEMDGAIYQPRHCKASNFAALELRSSARGHSRRLPRQRACGAPDRLESLVLHSP